MAFLCVSQQGEFKNTTKIFFAKKVEKKNPFFLFLSFPPFDFLLLRFRPFLFMRSSKNTITRLSKIRPENLKKSQKKR
jgi:hypothetical protein